MITNPHDDASRPAIVSLLFDVIAHRDRLALKHKAIGRRRRRLARRIGPNGPIVQFGAQRGSLNPFGRLRQNEETDAVFHQIERIVRLHNAFDVFLQFVSQLVIAFVKTFELRFRHGDLVFAQFIVVARLRIVDSGVRILAQ